MTAEQLLREISEVMNSCGKYEYIDPIYWAKRIDAHLSTYAGAQITETDAGGNSVPVSGQVATSAAPAPHIAPDAQTADSYALDLRSYGVADLTPPETKKWLDSIGGILGETFAHFVKTNPTGVVREIGGLLIERERQRNALQAAIDAAGEGLPPEPDLKRLTCAATREPQFENRLKAAMEIDAYINQLRESATLAIAKERQRAEAAEAKIVSMEKDARRHFADRKEMKRAHAEAKHSAAAAVQEQLRNQGHLIQDLKSQLAAAQEKVRELSEATDKVHCSCSLAERESGHHVDCFMPELLAAIGEPK